MKTIATQDLISAMYKGQVAMTAEIRDRIHAEWQPGQVSNIVGDDGWHYERFIVPGGYVVIGWDDYGNQEIG